MWLNRIVNSEAGGHIPEAAGRIPEAAGRIPEAAGRIPEAVGRIPEATLTPQMLDVSCGSEDWASLARYLRVAVRLPLASLSELLGCEVFVCEA